MTADTPAGGRTARAEGSGYAPVERRGLLSRMAHSSAVLLWLLAWGAGAAAAATSVVFVEDVPAWVALWGGGLVTWLHTVALAHRVGARTWLWGALAALAIAAALVTERAWALSGISVLAAVVSGVVAVLLTRPAATALGSLFEFGWAMVVAVAGALAVAGLNAPVRVERYTLAVLCLALALAIGLVWQLGAGLHGMGRRGLAIVVGGAALLAALLVYSQVLRTYGSEAIVDGVDDTVRWLQDNLHGVPRPAEALIGFPALVWGIATRASRRQGWWMCAFGALGTATVASSLAAQRLDPEYAALSALYSVVIGVLLGLLVRRIDLVVTGRRERGRAAGRRVLRTGEVAVLRPEPGRTQPLR